MAKLIFKTSFLFAFFIFLSLQGEVNFETSTQHLSNQVLNAQKIPISVKTTPDNGRIPLYFIPNEGQVDEKVLFYAKTSRYTLWLTEVGLVFDSTRRTKNENTKSIRLSPGDKNNPEDYKYDRDVSRLVFVNANRSPEVIPVDVAEHKVNYFKGNDKSKWRTDIQTSSSVLYKELYRNIDVKIYGVEQQIEYDFVVKPGGEVSDIIFEYKDIESTRIDKEGNLVIATKFGKLMQTKPVCYQVIEGTRIEVEAEFGKIEINTYGFEVKEYNGNYELIIDPLVLAYSTYLGDSDSDYGYGIAVDSEGAAYITGFTYSTDFPIQDEIQGSNAGSSDVFIAKVNPAGSALIYSTYLGGSDSDYGFGIAVDSEGAAYITGYTYSTDFPTKNPIQGGHAGFYDVFISKINPAGSALIYSTYLGGSGGEICRGIAVDVEGAVYVTGLTWSDDFPTVNPIQEYLKSSFDDIFVSKINPAGSALIYSTYLGRLLRDCGYAIAVDSEGAAYVTGYTILGDYPWGDPSNTFVIKIGPSGSVLDYLYEWGYGSWYKVNGRGIAVDAEGAAYVTWTKFPLDEWTEENTDAFVTKINVDGDNSIYTISLGGSGDDWSTGIAIDLNGAAYVTGGTDSDDFPIKNPIQDYNAGGDDIFIIKINPDGTSIVRSTYLGGSGDDKGYGIAVDSKGAVYVTGGTASLDFPTKNPIQASHAGEFDSFITKIYKSPVPDIKANGSDGPITITQGDTLAVILELDAGGLNGEDADWWLLMKTSDPKPNNWYYFDMPTHSWMLGRSTTRQGSIFNVSSRKVPKTSGLAPGTYTFFFAVDLAMNGLIDVSQAFYDRVKVTINP
jgi:hypothetical protein